MKFIKYVYKYRARENENILKPKRKKTICIKKQVNFSIHLSLFNNSNARITYKVV